MSRLNFNKAAVFTVNLTPVSVTNGNTVQQTFTVPGLNVGDLVIEVSKAASQNGLIVISGAVTAANTLGITFANFSGSPITPTAAEKYTIVALRPDEAITNGAAVFN